MGESGGEIRGKRRKGRRGEGLGGGKRRRGKRRRGVRGWKERREEKEEKERGEGGERVDLREGKSWRVKG